MTTDLVGKLMVVTEVRWACHGAERCGDPSVDYPTVARLLLEAGARADADLQHGQATVRAGSHAG